MKHWVNWQKTKFFTQDFFSKCKQTAFTEEFLNGKLHFVCSVKYSKIVADITF